MGKAVNDQVARNRLRAAERRAGGVKTYVAEIKGEAVVAFRAENDDMAYEIVNEKDDGMQLGLSESLSADGSPLWDEKSEITARPATEDRRGRREELAAPRRPQPVAQAHPRCKLRRRNRGRQIASSSCRLTPSVTKIRR
jgi:hypothetical protein